MIIQNVVDKALSEERISKEEALFLFREAPLATLCRVANTLRNQRVNDPSIATWQIDRNINITNVCISGCRFCKFHCLPSDKEHTFVTTLEEYDQKIREMFALGGDQILVQGGLSPYLDIIFYENLFRELKRRFHDLRINGLGAPEISHIAKISSITTLEALDRLHKAGLDTLPGAGAEILSPRVRKIISPAKPSVEDWCRVMHEAHTLGITTTATMMYGHIETDEEIIDHLILIRELQDQCPEGSRGFTAFIPWVCHTEGTLLEKTCPKTNLSLHTYLRIIAISRIVLDNIQNIQASWLSMGQAAGELALQSGANDLGSIMIEENVITGGALSMNASLLKKLIRNAGYTPRLRNQLYEFREEVI